MKNKTPLTIRFIAWLFPKLERFAPSLANKYFIYIFFTPFHYREPEKEREFLKTAKQFRITSDNKAVQCYRWGDKGPRIMLIHGWAGRTGQFRKIIPALLDAGFQVVAFDGPAHGKSEGNGRKANGHPGVRSRDENTG
jgi:pimeloyl-ACP methyl ester carboxylesterase